MKDARCCVVARPPTARYTGCSRKRYETRFSKSDRTCSLWLIDPRMTLSCRTRSALVWAALSFAIGGICNRIIIRLVAFGGLAAFSHFVSAEDLTGQVTLAQALALTLKQNPELAAFSWDLRSAEARILQARLRPNPEFGVQSEDVAGNKQSTGFSHSQ